MNFKSFFALCFFIALINAHASAHEEVSISNDGNFVNLKSNKSESHQCRLKGSDSKNAPKYKAVRLSFDRSAVLLDNAEYLAVADIKKCEAKPLKPLRVAPNAGLLADINLSSGIYISLDVVWLTPLSFLATVSKIGADKNLFKLPGAYRAGKRLSLLQKYGFSFNEIDPHNFSGRSICLSRGCPRLLS